MALEAEPGLDVVVLRDTLVVKSSGGTDAFSRQQLELPRIRRRGHVGSPRPETNRR
jgi:hypothetical protein